MKVLADLARSFARCSYANLAIALAVSGVLVGGYLWLASHHYDRGYAAHQAEIAKEIAAINKARDDLAAVLAHERLTSGMRRAEAVEQAMTDMAAYCGENPAACGILEPQVGAPAAATAGQAATPRKPVKASAAPPGDFCSVRCGLPAGVLASTNRIN